MYTEGQLTPGLAARYRAEMLERLTKYDPTKTRGKQAVHLYALNESATNTALEHLLNLSRPEVFKRKEQQDKARREKQRRLRRKRGISERAHQLRQTLAGGGSATLGGPGAIGTTSTGAVFTAEGILKTPRAHDAYKKGGGGYMSLHCRGRHSLDPKLRFVQTPGPAYDPLRARQLTHERMGIGGSVFGRMKASRGLGKQETGQELKQDPTRVGPEASHELGAGVFGRPRTEPGKSRTGSRHF